MSDKAEWRLWAQETRLTLDWPLLSTVLTERLKAVPEFQSAHHVLLYLAMAAEVSVEAVMQQGLDKTWYVPRSGPNRCLAIHPYTPEETPLRAGPFGIREPDPTRVPEADPNLIDFVVVPALLVSEQGERLGYGGGYYDRFLPRLRPDCLRVSVFPEALVVPTLPTDTWDIPLHRIITESRVLDIRSQRLGL